MGLVKNVGDKLDTRIKSGELKESELILEATEIMNKMKNMSGMGDIQELLAKMGMGGEKLNTGAMEAQLDRKLKAAKTKERILAKAERNRAVRAQQALIPIPVSPQVSVDTSISDEKLIAMFNKDLPKKIPNKKKKKWYLILSR